MVCQVKVSLFGDLCLQFFYGGVMKFLNLSALHADQMIVMIATIQFENRVAPFEVMTHHQARRLELGQYPIDRGQPNLFPLVHQGSEDVFGAEVLGGAGSFEDFEDLDSRERDLEPSIPDVFAFQISLLTAVWPSLIGYDVVVFESRPIIPCR